MPIELTKRPQRAADENSAGAKRLTLFNEDGALTLPGETIADFLESCDFSSVAASEVAAPFRVLAEDGDDDEDEEEEAAPAKDADDDEDDDEEEEEEEADDFDGDPGDEADESVEVLLPGTVVARLVDEADLVHMFGHYLARLSETVEESEDAMLQERAALACFAEHLTSEGISEASSDQVAEMIREVLSNGTVAAEIDEKFLTKGQRIKVARIRRKPKAGKKRMQLKIRRRKEGRGAKKAKIARQRKMFMRKRASRIKMLAREATSTPSDEMLLYGLGGDNDGANYKVALAESPNLAFSRKDLLALDRQLGNLIACPGCEESSPFHAFLALSEGDTPPAFLKKKDKDDDDEDDDDDDDDKDDDKKSKKKDDEKSDKKDDKKKSKKKDDDDDDGDDDEKDESSLRLSCPKCKHAFEHATSDDTKPKLVTKAPAPTHESRNVSAGPFAAVTGRPSLDEGASLAGRTLAALGMGRKPLVEDAD